MSLFFVSQAEQAKHPSCSSFSVVDVDDDDDDNDNGRRSGHTNVRSVSEKQVLLVTVCWNPLLADFVRQ